MTPTGEFIGRTGGVNWGKVIGVELAALKGSGVGLNCLTFLYVVLNAQTQGERVRSPCNPRKGVSINVTFGDLLKAIHSIAGRKGRRDGKEVKGVARCG